VAMIIRTRGLYDAVICLAVSIYVIYKWVPCSSIKTGSGLVHVCHVAVIHPE
jgi:hypothetical protein